MSLDDLQAGQRAIVSGFAALPPQLADYLHDLGLIAGEQVVFRYRAPLGDPVCIEIRGYQLALSVELARKIQVRRWAGNTGQLKQSNSGEV